MSQTQHTNTHGSVFSYTLGFLLSIILTLVAYVPVAMHQNSFHQLFSHTFLIPFVLTLAFLQLTVQLLFFLHLGKESGPRWNLVFFISTFGLVLLVVVMSIWIMTHLNNNMTPQSMSDYLIRNEGMHR